MHETTISNVLSHNTSIRGVGGWQRRLGEFDIKLRVVSSGCEPSPFSRATAALGLTQGVPRGP